jgi:hypothetical protein
MIKESNQEKEDILITWIVVQQSEIDKVVGTTIIAPECKNSRELMIAREFTQQ